MDSLAYHFFFNLSLLIVILFIFVMWFKRSGRMKDIKKPAIVYFIISLVVCNIFSFRLGEEFVLDLRVVPFIIGSLYFRLGLLLGGFIIALRAFHGLDVGFLFAVIFYGSVSYSMQSLSPWFVRQPYWKRILFSALCALLTSLLILLALKIIGSGSYIKEVWMAYIFIPTLGVAMIAYLIEVININIKQHHRILRDEKLAAVEQLGAALSHEIRNPLTTAIGFTQLLEEMPIKEGKRSQYLSIIQNELTTAENIIKDYLTFSKPAIDSSVSMNVNKEIEQLLKILEPFANLNSIAVETEFKAQVSIMADRLKFHHCFILLLRKVIESMPDGGNIKIATSTAKRKAVITISDNGPGMNPDQLNRLGEPYYRLSDDGDTGLPMMVAYSIIRAMRGSVVAHSTLGEGTVFQLTFPTERNCKNRLPLKKLHFMKTVFQLKRR